MTRNTTAPIVPGSRVAFSPAFLRSTSQHTGPDAPASFGPWARGTVVYLDGGIVVVRWDNGREIPGHVSNLVTAQTTWH